MRKALKYTAGGAIGATLAFMALGGVAYAQDEPDPVTVLGKQSSLLWVVIGAALVIFMQAGFALVETGLTQKKNAAHVMSTNFAIFGLGFVGFLFIGFPLAFGGFSYPAMGLEAPMHADPLIGSGSWGFLWYGWDHLGNAAGASLLGFFLYMVAFMDTTATIPTGSMAERWKWKSFAIWGLFCGSIYYPLFAAWTWGGGWLAKTWDTMSLGVGYADFAGSGVVHAAGGAAALAGALILGPRYGKIGPDGKPRAIPGHNIPMAQLGCFVLLFGWFGFNAASTFAVTDVQFATVAANTGIAAALGATTAMYYMTWKTGKPDPTMMINGMLAGLVAITAPCAFVAPWAAAVIGVTAAIIVIEAALFIDRKGIDDPVGAIAVHGVGGIYGVLCVGLFASGRYGAGWNGALEDDGKTPMAFGKGVFYGKFGQFGAQLLGAVVLCTVIFGVAYAFFYIQNKVTKGGIRSSEEDEINGLDVPEMGIHAYVD